MSSCGITSELEQDSAYRDSVAAHYAEHLRYLSTLDSVYRHDSVSVHSAKCRVQSGACVDTLYVERWHTYFRYRDRAVHDTVQLRDTMVVTKTKTRTITRTVKVPPDPHSPLALRERARILGKGCLIGGLGVLLLAIILYVVLRIYRNR